MALTWNCTYCQKSNDIGMEKVARGLGFQHNNDERENMRQEQIETHLLYCNRCKSIFCYDHEIEFIIQGHQAVDKRTLGIGKRYNKCVVCATVCDDVASDPRFIIKIAEIRYLESTVDADSR